VNLWKTRARTRTLLGLTTVMSLLLALAGSSLVLAVHVQPQLFQGQHDCSELGDYDHEFKIEPVTAGLHNDPNSTFAVTLTINNTNDGQTVDFVANLPVDAVFVKGGPGGNRYVYSPAENADTGLHAPGNEQGTAVETPPWAGLSHISFCFNDVPTATPTPTPEATATPTPDATATPTPEATATPTPEATATPTPDATATPTPDATATPTPEATATPTPDATATPTPTPDATATPTPTPDATATPTEPDTATLPTGQSGPSMGGPGNLVLALIVGTLVAAFLMIRPVSRREAVRGTTPRR
jgi:hypothetical protein